MKWMARLGNAVVGLVLICCTAVAVLALFKPTRHQTPFDCKQVAANEWTCR